jgi:hypothetical protein
MMILNQKMVNNLSQSVASQIKSRNINESHVHKEANEHEESQNNSRYIHNEFRSPDIHNQRAKKKETSSSSKLNRSTDAKLVTLPEKDLNYIQSKFPIRF